VKPLPLSSSGEPEARPGEPVLTGVFSDYWVARSSRAMTGGGSVVREDRPHTVSCARMSFGSIPAIGTGFFMASRRKGSPSSWLRMTSTKVVIPFA
jgi:hypothetical protein